MTVTTQQEASGAEILRVMKRVLHYSETTQRAHFTFTVGALLRGEIRRYLDPLQAQGHFTYVETKGFLESQFTIVAKNKKQSCALYLSYKDIQKWAQKLDS